MTTDSTNTNIQEKARQAIAQDRQQEEHLRETMQERATADLGKPHPDSIETQARESMTEQRHHQEHLEDTMRQRSEAELR
ncbi:MAG: hypothetical protein MUF49_20365 [Oculatellaceae cyanobacterium Prado106]|jgi:HSP20 family protein|nr:hypothetical protein [Oculatellaceae cyanobacterium Prado106]